ncbi:MAG: DUF1003 domain-containing protein [Patescibacteria group bacterium]|mgnify:CR=1 FL=1
MNVPLTLEQIREKRRPVRNVNIEHRGKLSSLEKVALFVTKKVGSMGFFIIILIWTIIWLHWNTLGPVESRFDPYPAFVLWLFISNLIQLILLPLIMVGQNLQGKHAEARAEADFELNVQAEREIETILLHLENQNNLISKILNILERRP